MLRPPIDPRLGNQRQKGLLKRIASQAVQKRSSASRIGRFSKTGIGAMPAGARGGVARMAKPFGSFGGGVAASLFSNPSGNSMPGQYRGPEAPGAQALGSPAGEAMLQEYMSYDPGQAIPPAEVGSNPFVTGEPGGAGAGGTATSDPESNQFLSGGTDINPFVRGGFGQSSPASPITAPGGLIPLGGGMYFDPVSGQIQGGGAVAGQGYGGVG